MNSITSDHPCQFRETPDAKCRMLRPALGYASNGLPVFPCRLNKKPFTANGFKDASTARQQIIAWWTANPDAMIGMPTGAISGYVVVDLDIDATKGIDGLAEFNALEKTAGVPIQTRRHRTPRGGIHMVFAHPGEPVKSTAGTLAPGVDTRGDGGYAILPPSKSDVGEYRVETDDAPAPLPDWLCDLFRLKNIIPAPEKLTPSAPRALPPGCPPSVAALVAAGAREGQRNDCALKVAAQLRDEGHDRATVAAHVLTFAHNCTPPFPEKEALAVVASAFSRPPREPAREPTRQYLGYGVYRDMLKPSPSGKRADTQLRSAAATVVTTAPREAPHPWEELVPLGGLSEPPPPWPWNALPPSLRGMGEAIERTYDVSAEMAAGSVLGVASIALSNKARVELKRDHQQYGNLLIMVVADVASGKSPVTHAAQLPLVEWQQDRLESWKHDCHKWEARQKRACAMIHGLEEAAKNLSHGGAAPRAASRNAEEIEAEIVRLRGEIGDRPPEPVLFCADATSEALGHRMNESGGAIGVLSGEARKILAIAKGRYVAEGGDIDLWLSGHAGDSIRVDRNNKEKSSYSIKKPCLSAAIMTQPDSLQTLGESECLRESGFLARWLYVLPDHERKSYPVESVPPATVESYGRTIRALIELPRVTTPDGTTAPTVVPLSATAFCRWRAYHDAILAETNEAKFTKPVVYRQWLGKLAEHVARLALLFHVVRHVEGAPLGEIGPELIEDAILVAEALKVHARRAFALMGGDPETARARKVWAWLNQNRAKIQAFREKENLPSIEAVKPRDLERAGVAGIKNSAEATVVLLLLADKGYLQEVDLQSPGAKGQKLFYLRPPAPEKAGVCDNSRPTNPTIPTNGVGMSGKSGLSEPPSAIEAQTPAATTPDSIEEGEI